MADMAKESVLKLKIDDPTVSSRKAGDFTFFSQKGWIDFPNGERRLVDISLPRDVQQGYPPGLYTLGASTFDIDKYGRLLVANRGLVLLPLRS